MLCLHQLPTTPPPPTPCYYILAYATQSLRTHPQLLNIAESQHSQGKLIAQKCTLRRRNYLDNRRIGLITANLQPESAATMPKALYSSLSVIALGDVHRLPILTKAAYQVALRCKYQSDNTTAESAKSQNMSQPNSTATSPKALCGSSWTIACANDYRIG